MATGLACQISLLIVLLSSAVSASPFQNVAPIPGNSGTIITLFGPDAFPLSLIILQPDVDQASAGASGQNAILPQKVTPTLVPAAHLHWPVHSPARPRLPEPAPWTLGWAGLFGLAKLRRSKRARSGFRQISPTHF